MYYTINYENETICTHETEEAAIELHGHCFGSWLALAEYVCSQSTRTSAKHIKDFYRKIEWLLPQFMPEEE